LLLDELNMKLNNQEQARRLQAAKLEMHISVLQEKVIFKHPFLLTRLLIIYVFRKRNLKI
jgi:hypothetical protein